MKDETEQSGKGSQRQPDGTRLTHSDDGVDLTLIRWMLAMSPAERLETLQQTIRSILRLRDARPIS